jgi:hypothetical protein
MFVTAYNFNNVAPEVVQEKVSNDVLVEPSDSYTVRELIYRLAMGMPVASGVRSGDYPDTDQDFDDVLPTEDPDFDLADYATLKADIAERERQRKVDMEKAYKEKLAKEKEPKPDPKPDLEPDPVE